jgi:hypothetical protein
MYDSIASALSSIKAVTDVAKTFKDVSSVSDIQSISIELRDNILSAQSATLTAQSEQAAMVQRIRDLEEEITRVKAWKEEKQRYQLVAPWIGAVTYALKEECSESEPPHWICTKCYEEGRKSILNQHKKHSGFVEFFCPVCKNTIEPISRYSKGFPVNFAEEYLIHG